MKTFIFPGQGSQFVGMGKGIFDAYPELVSSIDDILGYSIEELCLRDPQRVLNKTQYTQPAIYVVNGLNYLQRIEKDSQCIDFAAGHSLGEYSALYAANVFDFLTGLRLVVERARLMSVAKGGGMLAVVGIGTDRVKDILLESGFDAIDVANYNSPRQIVLSGPKNVISDFAPVLEQAGADMVIPLAVSGAFHSRYMKEASEEFRKYVNTFDFRKPSIPTVSNVTADLYTEDNVTDLLVQQLTSPVQWVETVRRLMAFPEMKFEEVGDSNVVKKLVSYIQEESTPSDKLLRNLRGNSSRRTQEQALDIPCRIAPEDLGSDTFRRDHGIRYAYVAGSMYKGISSEELVIRMAKSGFLSYFGTGGLSLERIEIAIRAIQSALADHDAYGMNLLATPSDKKFEQDVVDMLLRYGVNRVEASGYIQLSENLVRYRVSGLMEERGTVLPKNRILAKVSHPEVAKLFMSPPPALIVDKLCLEGKITQEQARLSQVIPMADDVCVEADSGGHTDQGVSFVLLPTIRIMRDELMRNYDYTSAVRIGCAGGIGTPDAAAAAFALGADFIMTGSINQCTVEAGTSNLVKNMLQGAEVQDTAIAPSGDMFELGANVQVFKKGVLFPFRAQKLYDLYRRHGSLDEIDESTRSQIENKYFKKSFEEIYELVKSYYLNLNPEEIEKAESNPKHKMALVFRWYFAHCNRLAIEGDEGSKVDYQIHTGPALGAFNRWVRGTDLEDWKHRHVDNLAVRIMQGAAKILEERLLGLCQANNGV